MQKTKYKTFDWKLVNIMWPNQTVRSEDDQEALTKYIHIRGTKKKRITSLEVII